VVPDIVVAVPESRVVADDIVVSAPLMSKSADVMFRSAEEMLVTAPEMVVVPDNVAAPVWTNGPALVVPFPAGKVIPAGKDTAPPSLAVISSVLVLVVAEIAIADEMQQTARNESSNFFTGTP
jgi:hypothetical protein